MALLNRIRILNFSYNNHARLISDETFDLFGGENVLMNMKNGGGKSVLTQLIMQPIVPKIKLMKRRMEDFFAGKGRKSPAYILLEWKLEDEGGYLLTGIAMDNVESKLREQEAMVQRVKYFTFTVQYKDQHPFDLTRIPLVWEDQNGKYPLDFKSARTRIGQAARDGSGMVQVFNEDEKEAYRLHLASFNIYQDEWKNLIREINESEGGLIEIFEKTQKSMNVLKDWLLPAVTNVIHKSADDQGKLETMMENLVKEWIENEVYLQKRSVYQDFLEEIRILGEEAEGLAERMDKKEETIRQLAGLHGYLTAEMEGLRDLESKSVVRIADFEKELTHIENEESSLQYYREAEYAQECLAVVEAKRVEEEVKQAAYHLAEVESKEQQAADYKRQIDESRGRLTNIEERLKANQNDEARIEQKKHLGYSLLCGYRERDVERQKEDVLLQLTLETSGHETAEWEKTQQALEGHQSDLQMEKGELNGKIRDFQSDEAEIIENLQFHFERNILGEIDENAIRGFDNSLKEQKENRAGLEQACRDEREANRGKEDELEKNRNAWMHDRSDATLFYERAQKAYMEYRQKEASLVSVYERNNRDVALRFQHENAVEWMETILREHEKALRASEFELKQVNEESVALQEGRFHASAALIHWLDEREIEYQTGEAYLKEFDAERRARILKRNPLLPFGFLLDDDAYERVADEIRTFSDRAVTPVFRYQSVKKKLADSWQSVEWNMIAPYQEAALDQKQIPELLEELRRKRVDLEEQINQFYYAANQARLDLDEVSGFAFGLEAEGDLKAEVENAETSISSLDASISEAEDERKRCRTRDGELIDALNRLENQRRELEDRIKDFHEFLKAEKENRKAIESLAACKRQLELVEKDLAVGREAQKERVRMENEWRRRHVELEREIGDISLKMQRYVEYESGQKMDGSVEFLQSQWDAMTAEWEGTAKELEEKRVQLIQAIQERKNKLSSLGIAEERLAVLEYRPEMDALIDERVKRTREEWENTKATLHQADLTYQRHQAKADVKREELEKPGKELLPREMILSNFSERRQVAEDRMHQEQMQKASLNRELNAQQNLAYRIEDTIDLPAVLDVKVVKPEETPEQAFRSWKRELRELTEEIAAMDQALIAHFGNLEREYCKEEDWPKKLLQGIKSQIKRKLRTYEDYYFVGERLSAGMKTLQDIIRTFEQKLIGLEKDRENLIRQSYRQAKRAFEELLKIEDHSLVELDGKSAKKMIRVRVAPLEETESENRAKMEAYIKSRVEATKLEMESGKSTEEIRKMIRQQMSTFELLGVLTDLSQFEVQAYKIDINQKNRRYKSWEKVVREHSGGERFVSFFALLVALMSYTRTSQRDHDNYRRNQDTKVLVMDNPFGPITSAHLLQPLFQIAKRYNTQLICLTDIKSNAVWDCFNVIYLLKIRPDALHTKEYVKAELELRDPELERESMEKAMFRLENTAQMRLDL